MNRIGIGIIGCGKVVTAIHLSALRRTGVARVVAVADPIEERCRRVAGLVACAASDWRQILQNDAVQAVLICSPSAHHAECAIHALGHGKHIYVEKPLASTLADAEAVLQAWQGSNLVATVGFNYRHHPLFMKVRDLVTSGKLGRLTGAQSVFTSGGQWIHEWKRKRASAGGVLLDLAGHHIDLVHFVLGQRVCAVSARVASRYSEQDTAWLRMTLQDGTVVQSFFSLYGTDANRFDIYGESGRASLDYLRKTLQIVHPPQSSRIRRALKTVGNELSRVRGVFPASDSSYAAAFSQFISAVANGGGRVTPDLADGLLVSKVIDAAERSAATGRDIPVLL